MNAFYFRKGIPFILACTIVCFLTLDALGQCDLNCNVFQDVNGDFTNELSVEAPPGLCGENLILPSPTVIGCGIPGPLTNLLTEDFSGGNLPGGWNLSFEGTGGNTNPGNCAVDLFSFDCVGAYPNASAAGPPSGFSGNVASIDDHASGTSTVGTACVETEIVDVSGFNSALVSFDYQNESVNFSGHTKVDYWDGSNWINILNTKGQGSTNGNFSALVNGNNANFKLRFCYDDDGGFNFGASFDNVIIDGTNTILPTPINNFNNSANASDFYPVGTTTVGWEVMDQMGNPVSCNMLITVEDVEDPVLNSCPTSFTQDTDPGVCQASVNWTIPTITDNCPNATLMSTHNPGDIFSLGTTTVTYTATDASNNSSSCDFDVTIEDNEPPMALCRDITIQLDGNGSASITAAMIDNGSVDNCGNISFSLDKSNFNCNNVGFNTVTLTTSDDSGNTSSCTSEVAVIASPVCPIPDFVNFGGPTIADPCTCRDPDAFDEEVVVQALKRQVWEVLTTSLLNPSAGLIPFPAATPLIENPVGSGNYTLAGVHIESMGYSIEVQSFFYPGLVLSLSNTCFYPDPVIEGLDGPICLYTPPITLMGNAGPGVEGTGSFTINGMPATIFDPMELGLGSHLVEFTFDAGNPAGLLAPPNIGCVETVHMFVEVLETPETVICNDLVQISVDGNCEGNVTPDLVLEGEYLCFDDYEVLVIDDIDTLGSTIPESFLQIELKYLAIHLPSGNLCWGLITAEDKQPPTLNCINRTIPCHIDIDNAPKPSATDNCDNNPTEKLIDQVLIDDEACDDDTVAFKRTWIAIDDYGNESPACMDTVYILRPQVIDFPNDRTWGCGQFNRAATSFSGVPNQVGSNKSGLDGIYCQYGWTYSDEELELCGGAPGVKKIIRTWTVLDWCTGQIILDGAGGEDNIQLIKFEDNIPPNINVPDDVTISANIIGSHPDACRGRAQLPNPTASDCTGIDVIKSFTPIGEAVGGWVPQPGLHIGTYTVTVTATDNCGNMSEDSYELTVVDDIVPSVICDEITEVDVSSDGQATVFAETFDDGSFDNCCVDRFEVAKMEDPCGLNGTEFGESVTFCCEDVPNNLNQVIFRVWDCYGNYNECMVQVEVEDKKQPVLVSCPGPQTITCDYFWDEIEVPLALGNEDVLDQFDTPEYADNCNMDVELTNNVNIDQCGNGTIIRTWQGTDAAGNGPVTCTQVITVRHISDWVVQFPADITANCTDEDLPDFGEPELFYETCELLAVSYEDVYFNSVPDACYKIARTWTVINWCVVGDEVDQEVVEVPEQAMPFAYNDLDGDGIVWEPRVFRDSWNGTDFPGVAEGIANNNLAPDTDNDLDPWDGFIQYEQHIKVIDDVNPVFNNGCDVSNYCIDDNSCVTSIELPLPITDDCSSDVTVTAESDLGIGFEFDDVPPGTYTVTYTAMDNCGNSSACQATFSVEDCKKPSPYCKNGLIVDIMNSNPQMIEIWANDFDDGSFDNCSAQQDLQFSFSSNTSETSITFDCDQLGTQPVEVWVTDEAGNQDFCSTVIIIQDNMNNCQMGDPLVQIVGLIANTDNESISGVDVNLSGTNNSMFTTGDDGMYEFPTVPLGGDYSIIPVKDINPLNGVSTFDLVLMTKHILGVDKLDSPYKIIAADVNKSETVTTFDLVSLRKLILHIDDDFANNTSWRFVDKNFDFPNPENPFETGFPEVLNFNNIDEDDLNADFVGVKVGDVNGSANPSSFTNLDDRNTTGELVFTTNNAELKTGEIHTVEFTAIDFAVSGYQFTLNFDKDVLELVDILPGLANEENFGLALLNEGAITTSWHNAEMIQLAATDIVFSLQFQAKAEVALNQALSINSRYTTAEAYGAEGLMDVALEFAGTTTSDQFELYQNTPNPFRQTTVIGFNLPEAGAATLTVTDLSGKVILVEKGNFAKGYNQIDLKKKDLSANGVMYYQLESATETATRKMILIK